MASEDDLKKALLVFSKLPRKGFVKTRLAKEVGDVTALKVYKKLLEKTLSEASRVRSDRFLYVFPGSYDERDFDQVSYLLPFFEIAVQSQGDLGEKIRDAISKLLGASYLKIVLIGSDTPLLNSRMIDRAFSFLDEKDLVVGPCEDGGYYLIGIKRDTKDWRHLFEGIPWGSKDVLEVTMERARILDIQVGFLPLLYDIDTGRDLQRWLIEENMEV